MATDQKPQPRTLYSGFEEFATPSASDTRTAFTTGTVALDTNTLLNLYRYNEQTCGDLLLVLEKIRDRLFIPQQVASEFWRNRESAQNTIATQGKATIEKLERLHLQSREEIRHWANTIALSVDEQDALLSSLNEGFTHTLRQIREIVAIEAGRHPSNTNMDSILNRLLKLTKGRIGPPLDDKEYAAAQTEGLRRVASKEPPGYKDSGKGDTRQVGDYLVWLQLMHEARRSKKNLLFVTGDDKEDWWEKRQGRSVGPRLELARELLDYANVRLFMTSPSELLERAEELLDVAVKESSANDAARVARSLSHSPNTPESATAGPYLLEQLPEGRTANYFTTVLDMLRLVPESMHFDHFIELFRERFPTITRSDEAARRARVLQSLAPVFQ